MEPASESNKYQGSFGCALRLCFRKLKQKFRKPRWTVSANQSFGHAVCGLETQYLFSTSLEKSENAAWIENSSPESPLCIRKFPAGFLGGISGKWQPRDQSPQSVTVLESRFHGATRKRQMSSEDIPRGAKSCTVATHLPVPPYLWPPSGTARCLRPPSFRGVKQTPPGK